MNNFRNLAVWHKSIDLVVKIYEVTKGFPVAERYGLTSQMQRSATSIPSNIAEGCGRNTNRSYKHFLTVSIGSAHELETQVIICSKLNFIDDEQCESLVKSLNEIQKMLFSLHNVIRDDDEPRKQSNN